MLPPVPRSGAVIATSRKSPAAAFDGLLVTIPGETLTPFTARSFELDAPPPISAGVAILSVTFPAVPFQTFFSSIVPWSAALSATSCAAFAVVVKRLCSVAVRLPVAPAVTCVKSAASTAGPPELELVTSYRSVSPAGGVNV